MKRYRCYFNRRSDAPRVWSIDEGDVSSEINVSAIHTRNADICTRTNLTERDTENKPMVWIEIWGTLKVEGTVATITGTRKD